LTVCPGERSAPTLLASGGLAQAGRPARQLFPAGQACSRVPRFRPPPPRRVAAILRRLSAWHGAHVRSTLGQLREEQAGAGAEDPFEILVGTLLSHRTRDERTYQGTKRLFARWPDAHSLARARVRDVREVLRGAHVGFYNVKAPRVVEVARLVEERHGGRVPGTLDGLLALPGVGRKTANCVLVYGLGKEAIPVDTHVHRISNRLGLVRTRTPDETEQALVSLLPRKDWPMFNELLVSYGKAVCKPVGPRCGACVLEPLCPSSRLR
jgi:endonuclease-3